MAIALMRLLCKRGRFSSHHPRANIRWNAACFRIKLLQHCAFHFTDRFSSKPLDHKIPTEHQAGQPSNDLYRHFGWWKLWWESGQWRNNPEPVCKTLQKCVCLSRKSPTPARNSSQCREYEEAKQIRRVVRETVNVGGLGCCWFDD